MQTTGIIAEFNPWHRGHEWLVNSVRQKLSSQIILSVMSGNFTQRGEPAITDKWVRTQMALAGGIDLVIELPVLYAVRSSNHFATGAIKLLSQAGATQLAFSCENPDLTLLKELAYCLNEEPAHYRDALKLKLAAGQSFAKARADALVETCYPNNREIANVLLRPNNILAVSYIQALVKLGWPLTPIAFKRQGGSYHSLQISSYPSATAIRHLIYSDNSVNLSELLPTETTDVLIHQIESKTSPPSLDIYGQILLAKLRSLNKIHLQKIYEMESGLGNRLLNSAQQAIDYKTLLSALKTKRYPYTRLQRLLFYILLDIEKEKINLIDTKKREYFRILGYSHKGALWLKTNTVSTGLILRRGRDIRNLLNSNNEIMKYQLQKDLQASDLYSLLSPNISKRQGGKDFIKPAIMHSI